VANAGLAEMSLPLDQLGHELVARVRKSAHPISRQSVFARKGN
jgi:hypothetical protein